MSRAFLLLVLLAGAGCGAPAAGPVAGEASEAIPGITRESLLAAARGAGEHLLAHQGPDGRFRDPYHPEEDAEGPPANLRRQAKAARALFRLHGVTGDAAFLAGGERALGPLLERLERASVPAVEGELVAVVEEDEDAPVGTTALLLLALLEHRAVTGEDRRQELMDGLGRFLMHRQRPDGRFELADPPEGSGRPLDQFPLPGEPGQAVLALIGVARLDPAFTTSRWYNGADRGSGWLMGARDLGKTYNRLPEDDWLMLALDELHELSGGRKSYYLHGRRMTQGILDELEEAATTSAPRPGTIQTARRATALAAMVKIARRAGVDDGPYLQALEATVTVLLQAQVTEEEAAALPNPRLAIGGLRHSAEGSALPLDAASYQVNVLLAFRGLLLSEPAA